MKLYALAISVLLSSPSLADDMSIGMLNKDSDGNKMIYSQEVANIDVGDTVTWLPTSKGHNVEMIASPNDMKLKSKNGKEVKITFDTPGVYLYVCTPHATMGMIGIVTVAEGGEVPLNDISKAKVRGKSKKKLKELLGEL